MSTIRGAVPCPVIVGFLAIALAASACAAVGQPVGSERGGQARVAEAAADQPARSESAAPALVPEAPAIRVRMGEFSFEPEALRLKAGQQVRLEFLNEGKIPHAFVVGREAETQGGQAKGYKVDFFAGLPLAHTVDKGKVGTESNRGTELQLKSGGQATLTFTVPADRKGEWEVGCFLPGHYEAGMKGSLIIE